MHQAYLIDQTISCCRLVYNLALETKIYAYRAHGKNLSWVDLANQLVDLKKEFKWMSEIDSQSLQASIRRLDKSFCTFFRGGGFPSFKGKRESGSFECPNNTRKVDFVKKLLSLPKIKNIPIVLDRVFEGKIKTVTISKTGTGKYYASIIVNTSHVSIPLKNIATHTTVGLDVGIKNFVITSKGDVFNENRKLKFSLQRLKVLQRRVSKKKQGSNNRKKANKRVAILHERIKNQRSDYIHKVTHALVHDSQVDSIVIEDLNVAGMLKNRKLSQALSDASFGEFYRILRYKCDWYGVNLIKINRFDPSSKRCSDCGAINKYLTLLDRGWECACGSVHDRDINAAKNIKWFGLNKSGKGIPAEPVEPSSIEGALKQELLKALL